MALVVTLGDLQWCAWTVALEAGWEPYEGQLAVAWVIVNRMVRSNQMTAGPPYGVEDIVLAPFQFSCWNDRQPEEDRLIHPMALQAAYNALYRLEPDPTGGATHYLNVELTRATRPDHTLPTWYDPAKVTAVIGKHTFLAGVA